MKNVISISFFTILYILGCQLNAQNSIQFTYDPSGNRTERNLILLPPETPGEDQISEQEVKQEEQQPEYSEVLEDHTITIFPNPNGGQFDVQITNLGEVMGFSITLYTMDGKEVYWRDKPGEVTNVNIRGRENGTYLLKVVLDGEVSSWKVIKR